MYGAAMRRHAGRLWFLSLALIGALFSANAHAVPSFARQTGMQCAACHSTIPELNSFGRQFKLTGYTIASTEQIKGDSDLSLDSFAPLSMMLQAGFTHVSKTVPGTQNNDTQFPQQLSLFYAGRITPSVGAFSQITYDQTSAKFNWDNTEIRYAASTGNWIYGATLNNAPTVEDLWNTHGVWAFPWAGSATAPAPVAEPLTRRLAQDSLGIGGFAMFDSQIYGDVSMYRSAHLGQSQPDSTSVNTISGVAPYWRLAWQRYLGGDAWMLGTYGMRAVIIPSGIAKPGDTFTDVAIDTQYEHPLGADALTFHAAYQRERMRLDASDPATGSANAAFLRADGTYHLRTVASFSLGYQASKGDPTLYWGTKSGRPDSNALLIETAYLPWQNTKLVLQYTAYTKFDGARSDYDGAGRKASDNNTLYFLFWFLL